MGLAEVGRCKQDKWSGRGPLARKVRVARFPLPFQRLRLSELSLGAGHATCAWLLVHTLFTPSAQPHSIHTPREP